MASPSHHHHHHGQLSQSANYSKTNTTVTSSSSAATSGHLSPRPQSSSFTSLLSTGPGPLEGSPSIFSRRTALTPSSAASTAVLSLSRLPNKVATPFRVGGRGSKQLIKALEKSGDGASRQQADSMETFSSHALQNWVLCKSSPVCFAKIISSMNRDKSMIQPLRLHPLDSTLLIPWEGHVWLAKNENLIAVEMKKEALGFRVVVTPMIKSWIEKLGKTGEKSSYPISVQSAAASGKAGEDWDMVSLESSEMDCSLFPLLNNSNGSGDSGIGSGSGSGSSISIKNPINDRNINCSKYPTTATSIMASSQTSSMPTLLPVLDSLQSPRTPSSSSSVVTAVETVTETETKGKVLAITAIASAEAEDAVLVLNEAVVVEALSDLNRAVGRFAQIACCDSPALSAVSDSATTCASTPAPSLLSTSRLDFGYSSTDTDKRQNAIALDMMSLRPRALSIDGNCTDDERSESSFVITDVVIGTPTTVLHADAFKFLSRPANDIIEEEVRTAHAATDLSSDTRTSQESNKSLVGSVCSVLCSQRENDILQIDKGETERASTNTEDPGALINAANDADRSCSSSGIALKPTAARITRRKRWKEEEEEEEEQAEVTESMNTAHPPPRPVRARSSTTTHRDAIFGSWVSRKQSAANGSWSIRQSLVVMQ